MSQPHCCLCIVLKGKTGNKNTFKNKQASNTILNWLDTLYEKGSMDVLGKDTRWVS